ncbi:MAG: OmpA family protein, partial [Deltaproteobacteria bacterium]|nr:OmpA family protein [Deltaproteobacteria bacterium]
EDCDQLPDRLDAETDPDGCDSASPGDTADTGNECVGDAILCGGHYTGGSCNQGGAAAGALAVGLAALALRRRRAAAATVLLAVPVAARAEEPSINAQRFTPAFDSQSFLGVNDSEIGPGGAGGGIVFNYADNPVEYRYDDSDTTLAVVDYAASFDLGVTYAWKPLAFAVDIPLHVVDGESFDGQFTLGDLRIGARGELLSRRKTGFGLGLYGGMRLPTGNEAAWVGAASPEGEAGLALAVGKNWVASANLGVRGASAVDLLPDLEWGTRLTWGAGLSVPIVDRLSAVAELDGESSLATLDAIGASPAEWRVGGRYGFGRNLVASAAFGTGMTQGVSAPAWRVIAGLGWVPAAPPVTATPAAPPAPPPQQNVVELDHQGGTIIASVQNGAGQPVAALVTLLGDGRKFTTGPDGIGAEKVPAGTLEISAWAEGYRPTRATVVVEKGQKARVSLTLEPSRVVVLADRVDIRDKIFFEFDSAVITADSFRILDDLAATLDNHVEIELLEVQGHTDDQGAEDYNQKLSQGRAEAVREYLVKSGIAGDRLVARGYGESQPLQPGTSEEAREVNRRVAFKILKGTKYPEAPPAEREQKGPRKRL